MFGFYHNSVEFLDCLNNCLNPTVFATALQFATVCYCTAVCYCLLLHGMSMRGKIVSNMQLKFSAKWQQSLANIIDEISDFFMLKKCLMADEAEYVHRYVERTERREAQKLYTICDSAL